MPLSNSAGDYDQEKSNSIPKNHKVSNLVTLFPWHFVFWLYKSDLTIWRRCHMASLRTSPSLFLMLLTFKDQIRKASRADFRKQSRFWEIPPAVFMSCCAIAALYPANNPLLSWAVSCHFVELSGQQQTGLLGAEQQITMWVLYL